MVGEEEEDVSGGTLGQRQMLGNKKMFWRSASWSASRTAQQNPDCSTEQEKSNGGQFRRFPVPLTPRSQQNSKIRSCLPPLQPLSIARRSLDEWPKAGSDDVGEWPQPSTPSGRGDSSRPGEGLKLDVSSFQKSLDPAGSFVNRDRIAFFDKECSKVADHIYLGGDSVARNRDILRQHGITHVLNCVGFVCPEYFKSDLVYKTLWLQDSPSEDITSILYDVFDYFEDVREQEGRVLVHCCQGVSRSTSLVIAYLMWREGQSFDDAFQYVKAARGIANPNMGFACQLLQCQKRVHAIPLSPSSLLRMYRMAPHSPYDPLHLVPKMLNDPSPSALDSRGAFIVHLPLAIYIWIGKSCEPIMERDAKGAAFQVVRYERVQGPIQTIQEGHEPSEFWDAFCNLTVSVDKSLLGEQVSKEKVESAVKVGPGSRKVDAYDVDFELFQKAITGGVVPPFSSSEAGQETHLPARENNWSVLRRKFTTGNMKEFVSAPKTSLCRVYSDSMLIVDNSENCANKNLLLLAESSTSSSSSYFSPSSLSSDSSTSSKFTESPSLSPTTSSSSLTPSPSSSSTLSNSPSSKKSNHHVLTNLGVPGIANTAKFFSQTVLSPSKRFAISIAERRGSLSPSLKLPSLNNEVALSCRKVKNTFSTSLATEPDDLLSSNSSCSVENLQINDERPDFKEENVREEGNVHREDHLLMRSPRPRDGLSCNGGSPVDTHVELGRSCHLQECRQVSVSTGSMDNGPKLCNGIQPLVRRWPGLEKISPFGTNDLDSNSAFLFSPPSIGVSKLKDGKPFLWIGKFFNHDSSLNQLNNKSDIGGVEEIDWSHIHSDISGLMGLPKDIPIKVVKEEEEPADFLELLNSL
ncbi:hypothetical protein AQUCO_02700246v1 [Aquilegia coerulea]|uniref:Protein-tyrosine-phosphatase n=1 Tax=Aquilegia coerulea TaxID=218851 RepID=A0A2G5D5Z4_AQUCA|nr:hypothetical protein AQUCO_02700246v1 [Aquilegia coerulea]PIA38925.1 hypothetical protein AQUCO_02700246v1 [Aquilegia coerulea]